MTIQEVKEMLEKQLILLSERSEYASENRNDLILCNLTSEMREVSQLLREKFCLV